MNLPEEGRRFLGASLDRRIPLTLPGWERVHGPLLNHRLLVVSLRKRHWFGGSIGNHAQADFPSRDAGFLAAWAECPYHSTFLPTKLIGSLKLRGMRRG